MANDACKISENPQLLIGRKVGRKKGFWTVNSVSGQKVTLFDGEETVTISLGRLLSGNFLQE